MDYCPHCGEPITDDAPSCPHCGSDNETGWNPEAEYLSVDLPDDEDDDALLRSHTPPPGSSRLTARGISGAGALVGGSVVLILAFGLLIAAGFQHYGWGIFAVAVVLLACLTCSGRAGRNRGGTR